MCTVMIRNTIICFYGQNSFTYFCLFEHYFPDTLKLDICLFSLYFSTYIYLFFFIEFKYFYSLFY